MPVFTYQWIFYCFRLSPPGFKTTNPNEDLLSPLKIKLLICILMVIINILPNLLTHWFLSLSYAYDWYILDYKTLKDSVYWSKSLVQQYLFTGVRNWHLPHSIVGYIDGFPCGNCGKVYKHRGNMRRHMVYECGKQARFECCFCFRKFHQQSNLKRHCESQHKIPNNKSITVVPVSFNVS